MTISEETFTGAVAHVAEATDELRTALVNEHAETREILEKLEGHMASIAKSLAALAENSDFDRVERETATTGIPGD